MIISYKEFTHLVVIKVAYNLRKYDILRDFIPLSEFIDMSRSVIKKAESAVIL